MREEKVKLLIENSKELNNVSGIFGINNSFKKCSALSLTIKNKIVSAKQVNKAIEIVKKNTSIFSNFRGNNLLTLAVCISLEDDMETSLKEIIAIYESLKNIFFNSQYLVLAAIIIYNSRYRVDINLSVKNTKVVYESMKKNHRFLTGSEDVSSAAMLAVTCEDLNSSLKEIECLYKSLRENGFIGSNNLQALSHILPLFNGSIEEKVQKVIKADTILTENKIKLHSYSLPLLGITAFIDDIENFALSVKQVSEELKKQKGFGNFTLGTTIRNMIAVGVVSSCYAESLDEMEKEKIINTTNNINLTIQIAIEMAAIAAASAAAVASASTN